MERRGVWYVAPSVLDVCLAGQTTWVVAFAIGLADWCRSRQGLHISIGECWTAVLMTVANLQDVPKHSGLTQSRLSRVVEGLRYFLRFSYQFWFYVMQRTQMLILSPPRLSQKGYRERQRNTLHNTRALSSALFGWCMGCASLRSTRKDRPSWVQVNKLPTLCWSNLNG